MYINWNYHFCFKALQLLSLPFHYMQCRITSYIQDKIALHVLQNPAHSYLPTLPCALPFLSRTVSHWPSYLFIFLPLIYWGISCLRTFAYATPLAPLFLLPPSLRRADFFPFFRALLKHHLLREDFSIYLMWPLLISVTALCSFPSEP